MACDFVNKLHKSKLNFWKYSFPPGGFIDGVSLNLRHKINDDGGILHPGLSSLSRRQRKPAAWFVEARGTSLLGGSQGGSVGQTQEFLFL